MRSDGYGDEGVDWVARFVAVDVPVTATAVLRKRFALDARGDARLHLTALGVVEAELNGRMVGDHVLDPGWTPYRKRLRYRSFDVTDLLVEGENVLSATVADGWYRGRLSFGGGRDSLYGDRLALLAQLEVDGSPAVVTDDSWEWAHGPTTRASIYDGEDHDARWSPSVWAPVDVLDRDLSVVVPATSPPVRVIEEVEPVESFTDVLGRTIVDFGQNLVGRLRVTTSALRGIQVVLRHAELLEDGALCLEPLRIVDATDRFRPAGTGDETWAPRFTFHGFRYAEVTGPFDRVVAEVLHTDLRRTGGFECSDERVNRLHENVVWGMRGNFLDIPTDCPQRDERLGWTGDLTAFAPTACFLYDVDAFLRSWLVDLALEQTDDQMPLVVPDALGYGMRTAVWGDAATEVPWTLYQRYGDREVLEAQYPSMRRWLETILRHCDPPGHWAEDFHLGDWLDPVAPPDNPAAGRTDANLVANAWFCHTAGVVAATAELLGEADDGARYREVEALARADFGERYVNPDGTMTSDSQTAYALAIRFGLGDREVAGRRLVELVEEEGHRIGTGFVGTPIICDALCDVGAVDTAYRLLLQTECPGWLYTVEMGATTIWERWDGIRPDGTRNPGEMNSFNHYALGAVADWLHRRVAGLAPAAPGYSRVRVAPLPGPGLDHARAWLDTPHGRVEVGWSRDGDAVVVHAEVPVEAEVLLPDGREPFTVGPGSHSWVVGS